MKKDIMLAEKTANIVMKEAYTLENGESKTINIQTAMEIENGEDIVGYQYLHGTNELAGGYQIKGTITKNESGDLILDLNYTWNDIIDPNLMYTTDKWKSELAKKFADPQDYQVHISWNDKTVIYADGWKEGWLKNTEAVSSQSELINPDGISALGHYWGMVSNREKKVCSGEDD